MNDRTQLHGADVNDMYGPGDLTDALINFATNLDPNGPTLIDWPAYTSESPALLMLTVGNVPQSVTGDTFRQEGMKALMEAFTADPY